jgi:GNAT superfamily N-acetyltransferase
MLTAQVEPYQDCLPELAAQYEDHWRELALDKEQPEAALDPMWEVYNQRDAMGQLLLVTLRERGALVGYFIGFIAPGLHYRRCLTYQMDIFRVLPSVRGRFGGKRLLRAVVAECKRRGVRRMFIGEKLHTPSGRLLEAFGFRPVEVHYSLWLGAD